MIAIVGKDYPIYEMENSQHVWNDQPVMVVFRWFLDDGSYDGFWLFFDRLFDVSLIWVNYNDLTVLPHWNHG